MPCWLLRSVCECFQAYFPFEQYTHLVRSTARLHVPYRRIYLFLRTSTITRRPDIEVRVFVQEGAADEAVDQTLVRLEERRLVVVSVRIGEIHMSASRIFGADAKC